MKRTSVLGALVLLLFVASPSSAQLLAAKDGPIVYGHHHVAASDIAAHKKFWADTLGGTVGKFGNNAEIVKFPNVLIFFRDQKPTGGTIGTTANHIGFSVPNLRAVVDKVKANGYKMITSTEMIDQMIMRRRPAHWPVPRPRARPGRPRGSGHRPATSRSAGRPGGPRRFVRAPDG